MEFDTRVPTRKSNPPSLQPASPPKQYTRVSQLRLSSLSAHLQQPLTHRSNLEHRRTTRLSLLLCRSQHRSLRGATPHLTLGFSRSPHLTLTPRTLQIQKLRRIEVFWVRPSKTSLFGVFGILIFWDRDSQHRSWSPTHPGKTFARHLTTTQPYSPLEFSNLGMLVAAQTSTCYTAMAGDLSHWYLERSSKQVTSDQA